MSEDSIRVTWGGGGGEQRGGENCPPKNFSTQKSLFCLPSWREAIK